MNRLKALFEELQRLYDKEKRSTEREFSVLLSLKEPISKKDIQKCKRIHNQEWVERKAIIEKISEVLKRIEKESDNESR